MRRKYIISPSIIYGMSMEQSKAKRKISGFEEEISSNIIKLCAYPDSRDRQHWIDELATWFSDINNIDLKPKGKKFNSNIYDELVFGDFGTSISDVKTSIDLWLIKNTRNSQKYPKFNNDRQLTHKVFLLVNDLRDNFLKIFSCKNNLSRNEILNMLKGIISGY